MQQLEESSTMKKNAFAACIAALIMTVSAHAGSIFSSVNPISSSQEASIEAWVDSVNIYKDREPGHRLVNIPIELTNDVDGPGEIIQNSNSDKTLADYQIEVTTNRLAAIYIGLDARHADSHPLPWMQDTSKTGLPSIFFNTGRTVDIDEGSTAENAGDDVDNEFVLWATIAPAGTYNFFEQTFGGGSNNYFIAADETIIANVVPEPATLSIIGVGLCGLLTIRRRRK